MSLNEKYIINGSTLSDIGNALRTSGLIPPTKEVIKPIWYKIDSGSASGNGSSTSTIDQSFFSVGNAIWDGTIAKVKIVITSGNPKINGAQYYNGNTVTVNIPCTISISGSIMYPSNTYSYGCKIYPLTSDGQNIDCIQASSYGGVYSENSTVNVPNTIAVEDIANTINSIDLAQVKYKLKWMKISMYTSGSGYSTSLAGLGINKIQDILFIGMLTNSNPSTWWTFIPATAETSHVGKLNSNDSTGNYSDVTWYRARIYNTSSSMYTGNGNATDSKWENNASTYGYYYFEPVRKALVCKSSSDPSTSYYHPAIIVYKPSGTETE